MKSLYFIVALLLMIAGCPSASAMTYDIKDYRLITKDRPNVGVVEIYTEERGWGLICMPHWNFELASKVCENLNFPGTSRYLNAGQLVAEGDEWLTFVTNNASIYYHSCSIHGRDGQMDMRCGPYAGTCDKDSIAAVTCKEPGYLGCFIDYNRPGPGRDRVLSDGERVYTYSLTIDLCINVCKLNGFYYAGVEYQVLCFCGAQEEDYSRHGRVSDEQCHFDDYPACPGDHLESCGAQDRIAVYLVKAGQDFCDDPGFPANGSIFLESLQHRVGSEAYFQCSDGFVLEGPEVTQCVETYVTGAIVTRNSISNKQNVMWNDSLPNCTVNESTPRTYAVTTQTAAIINPVTSFGTRDPTKQEGVLATIITIAILVTLFVIAVLVFIVWRRKKKSAANPHAQHQTDDDSYTPLNMISGTAGGRGSGDGRGPGDGRGTGDGQAAASVYQPLNEPAYVSSGIRTGLNVDGYYEDTKVDNEYYEISAERDPEGQGNGNQLGQDGDERKASRGFNLYGNQKIINQREQRSGRAHISSRKAKPEYFKPI